MTTIEQLNNSRHMGQISNEITKSSRPSPILSIGNNQEIIKSSLPPPILSVKTQEDGNLQTIITENDKDIEYIEEVQDENTIKKCPQCLKDKKMCHFISLINGTETTICLECREIIVGRDSNKEKYRVLKALRMALPPCEFCGDDDYTHKEFDHIDPSTKLGDVSTLPVKRMVEEAPKCRSACTKCHRKKTIKNIVSDRKHVEIAKEFVKQYKIKLCGCQNPNCKDIFDPENLGFYEFDHIDFKTKYKSISDLATGGCSIEILMKELIKCILLCSYCHAEKTKLQKKEKKAYYKSLKIPLQGKRKKIIDNKIPLEDIKEMRKLFNEGKTTLFIGNKFNIAESKVYKIIDNAIYIDPEYQRIRPKRKKYPVLSEEHANEIRDLWKRNPRPHTSMKIQEMYNCGKAQFEKIVYTK